MVTVSERGRETDVLFVESPSTVLHYIVALKKDEEVDMTKEFGGGSVVATVFLGDRGSGSTSCVSFVPTADRDFFLWTPFSRVESFDARAQTVLFGSFDGYLTKNFEALVRRGVFD